MLAAIEQQLPILFVVPGHGQFEHFAIGPVDRVHLLRGGGNRLLAHQVGQLCATTLELDARRVIVDEVHGDLDLLEGQIECLLLNEFGDLFEELGKGLASHLAELCPQPVGRRIFSLIQGVESPLIVEGRILVLEIEPELVGLVFVLLRAVPEKGFEKFHITVRSNAGPTEDSLAV